MCPPAVRRGRVVRPGGAKPVKPIGGTVTIRPAAPAPRRALPHTPSPARGRTMPVPRPRPAAPAAPLLAAAAALLLSPAAAPAQVELEPTPPFEPPQLQPSLLDFLTGRPVSQRMEIAHTPELLQPEFAGAPLDSPKGLAAAIKALELDVPNRVAAARYLGTLDCVQFPEAKQQLIAMATEDPFEEVRYAAVMSLRVMLARGTDNPKRANGWKAAGGCGCQSCVERAEAIEEIEEETEKFQRKGKLKELCPANPCEVVTKTIPGLLKLPCERIKARRFERRNDQPLEATRLDFCEGCCDEETMNALAAIAYDQRKESLCPVEPSVRVREAAAQALLLCGCYKRAGFVPDGPDVTPAPMPLPLADPDVVPAPAPRPLDDLDPDDEPEFVEPRREGPVRPRTEGPLDLERRRDDGGDYLDVPRVPGDTDGDGKYELEIDPGDSDAVERLNDALDAVGDDLSGTPRRRRVRPAAAAGPGRAVLADAAGHSAAGPAAAFVPAEHAAADAPPVAALDTLCLVSLRNKSFAPASPEHRCVYGGRTYFFSSAAARAAFLADPADYAPAYCGVDPVAYLDAGELTEGAVLRQHAGRFYLFATAANWETFKANPARYARD